MAQLKDLLVTGNARVVGKIYGSITEADHATNADTVNNLTVLTAVPANAVFTDTTYTFSNGLSISGTTVSNSGVRSIATGTSNGTISVNTDGTSADVAVKGLGSLAYKSSLSASEVGAIASTLKGVASGVAELDANGLVPSSQLPSYVDDVLEYSSKSSFPSTGETGKIYVATDTNLTYRWSGSAYTEISPSLALGETSSTAYRGDRGATAYSHSQITSGNPHNVTASDVGLGNVGNFKAVSTVASQGLTSTEKSNARTNIGAGTSSLALGETNSTAYYGDKGKTAYTHATDSSRLTTATESGLYKVASTAEGHIASLTAVQKLDITTLGIPAQDTTYSDATTSSSGLMPAIDKAKVDYTNIAYCTCSTAAATAKKVITVSGNTNWALKEGSLIVCFFSATNTASNPTFNVNGTGDKNVFYGANRITTSNLGYAGTANYIMTYIYDGTQFRYVSRHYDANDNTTYTNAKLGQGYGTCETEAATATKVVSLSSYVLTTGGIVTVKFSYDVPANATMNINTKGEKAIYYKGAAITGDIIKSGDTATFIYSTYYHLITIDRWQDDITAASSKLNYTNIAYATCSTAAATAAKEATVVGNPDWKLENGSVIAVKFTNTNTASYPTLNVNNTGAKSILINGAGISDTQLSGTGNNCSYGGIAARTLIYVYDGSSWECISASEDLKTIQSSGKDLTLSISNTANLDNLTATDVAYYYSYSSAPSNSPIISTSDLPDSSYTGYKVIVRNWLMSLYGFGTPRLLQTATFQDQIYYRFNTTNSGWSSWVRLATTDYVDHAELPVNSIIKYNGSTVPNGYEEVCGFDDYSTDEKLIGTWLDGKPLYKKTIVNDSLRGSSATISVNMDINIPNISEVVKLEYYIIKDDGSEPLRDYGNYHQDNEDYQRCMIRNMQIRIRAYFNLGYTGVTGVFTIYYTKTTN